MASVDIEMETYADEFHPRREETVEVGLELVGNRPFIRIDGDMLSLEELRRYRKTVIVNAMVPYSANIFMALCLLILSFFSYSWSVFIFCCLSFVCSVILFFSPHLASWSYSWITGFALAVQEASIVSVALSALLFNISSLFMNVCLAMSSMFSFIVMSISLSPAQRLQTIYRIVPVIYHNDLK
ncbi:hypothetical protein WA171_003594 [Blastocystis sp. BT1]